MDTETPPAQVENIPIVQPLVTPGKKKSILPVIAFAVIGVALTVYFIQQQGVLEPKITITPTPIVTQYVETEIKLATAPVGLSAEVGKEVTYHVVVIDDLVQTRFSLPLENTNAKNATISDAGLVTWIPSIEDIGERKIEVLVTSGNRSGVLQLNFTVEEKKVSSVNKNAIPSTIKLPQFPVFYLTGMKGKNQLWVMNRDGTQKQFTGVSGITGIPQNIRSFGGVVYTASNPKNTQQSEMAIYVFYTAAKQTVRIPVTATEKGLVAMMGNVSVSPSAGYLLYAVAFDNPKSMEMGYEMEKTFSYNVSTKKHTEITGQVSSDMVWGVTPGTVFKARDDGIYTLDLDTLVYTKVDNIVDGIPNDYNLFQLSASTYIRLTGDTTTENKLLLRVNGTDSVMDTGEWADMQPFFCASPDNTLVLYERRVELTEADPSMPQTGIRAIDIQNKVKKDIHMNLKLGESYNIKGCYWTSANTVLIELFKDYTARDLAQLNISTGEVTVLTTEGDVALSY